MTVDNGTQERKKFKIAKRPKKKLTPDEEAACVSNKTTSGAEEDTHLNAILEANGFTMDEYHKKAHVVEYLEMFQVARVRRLLGFTYFTGVKHIEIMDQVPPFYGSYLISCTYMI